MFAVPTTLLTSLLPVHMEIDEEPNDGANTCSAQSRRQCYISTSVLVLIVSILYVATTIIYTSYTMVVDMDLDLTNNVVKTIGIYDTCAAPPYLFNIDEISPLNIRITWMEEQQTQATMRHVYLFGANAWAVLPNMTIQIESTAPCNRILLIWTP